MNKQITISKQEFRNMLNNNANEVQLILVEENKC